ncbi:MAG: hypothetical protein M1435_00035, partial [Actinobacteria bacterium]|nr:hypothetical protein [Actinomycetota bacterium]
LSRKIGEEFWLPKLRAALAGSALPPEGAAGRLGAALAAREGADDGAVVVCDGFSCRTQLEHLGADLVSSAVTLPGLLARAAGCAQSVPTG